MRPTRPLRLLGAALAFAALWLSLSHVHESHDDQSAPAGALHARHAGSTQSDSVGNEHADNCRLAAAPHVSSDDDHHEHSSRAALALEACFACRSSYDDELLAADSLGRLALHELVRPRGSERDVAASGVLAGLPAPRAPPVFSRSTPLIS